MGHHLLVDIDANYPSSPETNEENPSLAHCPIAAHDGWVKYRNGQTSEREICGWSTEGNHSPKKCKAVTVDNTRADLRKGCPFETNHKCDVSLNLGKLPQKVLTGTVQFMVTSYKGHVSYNDCIVCTHHCNIRELIINKPRSDGALT